MPKTEKIVIDTSPLIALVGATEDFAILQFLYQEVFVPFKVSEEILNGGKSNFAVAEFQEDTWLKKQQKPVNISPLLLNLLDRGEAAVIQLALDKNKYSNCLYRRSRR